MAGGVEAVDTEDADVEQAIVSRKGEVEERRTDQHYALAKDQWLTKLDHDKEFKEDDAEGKEGNSREEMEEMQQIKLTAAEEMDRLLQLYITISPQFRH